MCDQIGRDQVPHEVCGIRLDSLERELEVGERASSEDPQGNVNVDLL